MNIDLDIAAKIANICAGLGALLVFVGGAFWAVRSTSSNASHTAASAHAAAKDAKLIALAADEKAVRVAADLAHFREEAAGKFVTDEALGRLEGQISEVGREMRAGLDGITKQIIELFSRPSGRTRSGGQ